MMANLLLFLLAISYFAKLAKVIQSLKHKKAFLVSVATQYEYRFEFDL